MSLDVAPFDDSAEEVTNVHRPESRSGSRKAPRLLLIGFHSRPGGNAPTSQNELQAILLRRVGYEVKAGSDSPQPLVRLADQLLLVARYRSWADAVVVDAFSERRFWTPFFVTRMARWYSRPCVVVLHGGALPQFAEAHPRRLVSTLRVATRVVAPSPFLRRRLRSSEYTIDDQPNLVEIDVGRHGSSAVPSNRRVLWMRAFDHDYQPRLALEAFAALATTHADVRLTMAGPDGGLLSDSIKVAQRLGIADRVDFPGHLDAPAKLRALIDHDVFLNTTRVDNTPVSVIEATAAGLPVVATDVGGLRDLLDDGVSALLVPDSDADALAAALASVLDDHDLRSRLIDGGRRVAAGFSPAAVTSAWDRTLTACGVVRGGSPSNGCGPLSIDDLDEIVVIHQDAFPSSAMTKLGAPIVRRYYRWQFIGPHPAPVALGVWRDGRLDGMLFGGRRRVAVVGFVRRYGLSIVASIVCHPAVARSMATPKILAVTRLLRRSARRSPAEPLSQVVRQTTAEISGADVSRVEYEQSFGILSIAVRSAARGSGAAVALMEAAERAAIDAGLIQMHLTVQAENERAIAFYEKLGWRLRAMPDGWRGEMYRPLPISDERPHVPNRAALSPSR